MRLFFNYLILFLFLAPQAYAADLSINIPGLDPIDKTAPPKASTTANNATNTKQPTEVTELINGISAPMNDNTTFINPKPIAAPIINGVPTPINITINQAPSASTVISEPKVIATDEPISRPKISNTITIPPVPSFDIVINKKYYNSPKVHKLYRMLGIKNSPRVIHFVADKNVANVKDSIIYINIRSFVSVLAFLSNSVQVVPSMLQQKLVIAPKNPDGTYFNLNLLTKGLLLVHISSKRPQSNVSVEVFYRNYWFYIMDNDYKSKRTFSMIEQLFNLQAGEIKGQTSPVLTIPTR